MKNNKNITSFQVVKRCAFWGGLHAFIAVGIYYPILMCVNNILYENKVTSLFEPYFNEHYKLIMFMTGCVTYLITTIVLIIKECRGTGTIRVDLENERANPLPRNQMLPPY